MLATPLLRVTVRKGTIMPLFCTRNDELELAERILEEFQTSFRLHERKSELNDRISAIESSNQTNYKLVRGLCALLERRCVFSALASSYPHVGSNSSNSAPSYKNNDNGEEEDARAANSQLDNNKNAPAITMATAVVDPVDVRRMLFEESSKRGFALTELERESIINFAAEKLRVSSNDIKSAMWSDMDDNLVFQDFNYIDTKTLVGWYNLSLMQTLLFNATKMEFHVSGGTNWKHVLRNVKRLGLMYYLENRNSSSSHQQQHKALREKQEGRDNEAWRNSNSDDDDDDNSFLICSLEGPLSLFKLTDRYGTSLAKLIPSIVLLPKEEDHQRHHHVTWQIDAWILRKTMMQGSKLYQFKISSEDDALPHLADPLYAPASAAVAANNETNEGQKTRSSSSASSFSSTHAFDSLVEEKFARKFNEVVSEESGWKLVREPDPLILADGKAFIPDFMFEKYGRRVYLEIVGFWTPEYLERKFQKVKQLFQATSGSNSSNSASVSNNKTAVVDLFIAINEELAGARVYSSSHHPPSSSTLAATTTTTTTTFSSSVPTDRLIFYKNNSVPIRPILEYLKALDKEMIDKKLSDPNLKIAIDRSKDIISIEDLAEQYNLPVEVVSKIASRDYGDQYISIDGNSSSSGAMGGAENNEQRRSHRYLLISRAKASKLESQLREVNNFTDACAILSKHDVPESCHAALVDRLGYEVVWQSMDISTATIKKREKRVN